MSDREFKIQETVEALKKCMEEKTFLDVSKGAEAFFGVSRQKFQSALALLKGEGYEVVVVLVNRNGSQERTSVKVLAPHGTTYRDIITDPSAIQKP